MMEIMMRRGAAQVQLDIILRTYQLTKPNGVHVLYYVLCLCMCFYISNQRFRL